MLRKQPAKRVFSTTFSTRYRLSFAIFALLACFSTPAFTADRGGTLVAAYKDEPSSLNPLLELTTISSVLNQIIFDGLITLSPTGEIGPRVADRWIVSNDGLSWTFYLRKDVRFHDGTQLKAKAVKFTFDSLMKAPKLINIQQVMPNVEEIRILDDYTLRFELRQPGTNFLMDLYTTGIVPEHILKGDPFGNAGFNKKPIGTGPFKVASWRKKKEILLESNGDYFRGEPYISRIRLKYVPDFFLMWKQLQLGRIDAIYNDVLPVDFEVLKQNSSLKTYRLKDNMVYLLIFNLKKKVFQDERMRTALSIAVDRREIIRLALQGSGIEANGPFLPGALNISSENTFNPEKSIKLLAEMGYTDNDGDGILEKRGKNLKFKILMDKNNVLKERAFLSLQKQFMEIGVEVIGEERSIPEIFSRSAAGDFDMIFYNYAAWLDMPAIVWHSKSARGGFNLSHYGNIRVDSLFERLSTARDRQTRTKTMELLHREITGDSAAIFLFTKYNLSAINTRVRGFIPEADKFFWEFATDIYIPRELQ